MRSGAQTEHNHIDIMAVQWKIETAFLYPSRSDGKYSVKVMRAPIRTLQNDATCTAEKNYIFEEEEEEVKEGN